MKRGIALVGLVCAVGGVVATGVTAAQHLRSERYYHQLLDAGETALAAGNTFAALESFSGAVALRPDAMVAYYRRAEAYRLQRQFEKAAADLRVAMRISPDAPEPRIALGDLFDAQGEPAQAATWYRLAADRLKDEDPALLYRLAVAYYRAGMPAAAIEPLQQAIARNDSFAEAHYLLGLAYRDAQKTDAAIASLEQAIRIAPSLTAAREELADLYRSVDRAADEMLQLEALSARDDVPARRMAVALAGARQGQFERALGVLADEEAREPTDSRVHLALGRVHLMMAERTHDRAAVGRALSYLERALGGTARRSEGLALFGRALDLSGDAAQAERILREAIATSPVYPAAFEYYADVAQRRGHAAEARDALFGLDALQGSTGSATVRLERSRTIGMLSLQAGDARTAVEYLQQAIAGGLDGAATLGLLAQARWSSGDVAGARQAIDRALSADPKSPELQRLARTIRGRAGPADPAGRPPRN